MKFRIVAALGVALAAVSVSPSSADPLPFPDGKYVTDASLCQLSDQEMANRHGDMIGTMVRIIRGNQIYDGGERFCTVRSVNVVGANVRFRAYCASEGQTETVNGRYMKLSATSFRLGGQTFRQCSSRASAKQNPQPARSSGGSRVDETQQCDGTTTDMVQCINGLRDRWDRRLNAAYKKVMDAESAAQKAALRSAQRQWIAYRDANCTYYAGGEGSIARIEAASCDYSLTRDRARELEQIMDQ